MQVFIITPHLQNIIISLVKLTYLLRFTKNVENYIIKKYEKLLLILLLKKFENDAIK